MTNKPSCKTIVKNDNIFNILASAARTLKDNGLCDQATEMYSRVTGGEAQSYEQALRIIAEYVDMD